MREIKGGNARTGRARRKQSQSVAIQYLPPEDNDNVNLALLDMAEQLYRLLECLPVNNSLYRGSNMHHAIADGVLSFFADYPVHTIDLITGEPMADIPALSVTPGKT